MNLQALKPSHWVVAGMAAGLVWSAGQLLRASNEPIGGAGFIGQAEFEHWVRATPRLGSPWIADVIVHPRTGPVDLVTFRRLLPDSHRYDAESLAAPKPYVPLRIGPSSRPVYSVREYLAGAAPSLRARYAWWDEPRWIVLIWTTASVVLIGGVWPVVMRILAGAGSERKEKEEYDLDRFHHGREPADKHGRGTTRNGRKKLEELEAEMLAALTAAGPEAVIEDPKPETRNIKLQLTDKPLEPVAAPSAEAQNEYAGEFYPVAKKAPHGFTLVELLVVMGIILVLVSLLAPAIVTAQRQAQTTQCASNLRQIGTALIMYANHNGGSLPAWSGWHTWPPGLADDSAGPAWTIELMPYIGRPDLHVYNCPSFPARELRRNYFMAAQWSGRSGRHAMKLSDIKMTSRFVLGGDKTQRRLYPPPFGSSEHANDDADPDDSGAGDPVLAWPWDDGGFYMHRHGNNVLFDDTHVGFFDRYNAQLMTFNPKVMQDWAEVTPDASGGGGNER